MVRYFETLRRTLSEYQSGTLPPDIARKIELISSINFEELYLIQHKFVQPLMRELVSLLVTSVEEQFISQVERRLATFICFIIALLIAFVIVWLPFVNNLNNQIYKSKSMLMIIPIEILVKMRNVQKIIQSQSFTNSKA